MRYVRLGRGLDPMMALLQAQRAESEYEQQPGETDVTWLQRTTMLAMQVFDDGTNPVISAEEWSRMKEKFRDFCLQTDHLHDEVSSGTK